MVHHRAPSSKRVPASLLFFVAPVCGACLLVCGERNLQRRFMVLDNGKLAYYSAKAVRHLARSVPMCPLLRWVAAVDHVCVAQ